MRRVKISKTINKIKLIYIVIISLPLFLLAESITFDTLSGPLPKLVTAAKSPYIITSDIEVPFGKTVTIEPGVVFLFQNFVGFRVMGQLISEGTKAKPIVFTSEFDGEYLKDPESIANPFDWNGVYIHKDGFGTRFSYTKIGYSVYGIKSDTRLIRLDPCIFNSNGKANLTIADSLFEVEDNKGFTYVLSTRDASIEGISVKLIEDPLVQKRRLYRIGGGSTFALGAGATAYGFYELTKSSKKLDELSSDDPSNITGGNTIADWEKARKKRNLDLVVGALGAAVAVFGAIGFTVSFTF